MCCQETQSCDGLTEVALHVHSRANSCRYIGGSYQPSILIRTPICLYVACDRSCRYIYSPIVLQEEILGVEVQEKEEEESRRLILVLQQEQEIRFIDLDIVDLDVEDSEEVSEEVLGVILGVQKGYQDIALVRPSVSCCTSYLKALQTAQVAEGLADVDGSLKKEDKGRFQAQEEHDLVSISDVGQVKWQEV